MIGFAKNNATVGSNVSVTIWGAMDGYSGLSPGAPYFARYDGGIGAAINIQGGVSPLVVGRAIAPDVLYSLVRAVVGDVAVIDMSVLTCRGVCCLCVGAAEHGWRVCHGRAGISCDDDVQLEFDCVDVLWASCAA